MAFFQGIFLCTGEVVPPKIILPSLSTSCVFCLAWRCAMMAVPFLTTAKPSRPMLTATLGSIATMAAPSSHLVELLSKLGKMFHMRSPYGFSSLRVYRCSASVKGLSRKHLPGQYTPMPPSRQCILDGLCKLPSL